MYKIGNSYSYPIMSDFSFKSAKTNSEKSEYISDTEYDTVQFGDKESGSAKEINPKQISNVPKTHGVNFDKLDKDKTYIGMQYGRRNKLARQIVKFTKKYCSDPDVPAHVFALSYKDGNWWVHEAHIIKKEELGLVPGSHKLKADDWINLGKNAMAETDVYEADFDVDMLDENAGQPYGKGDMFKQLIASIFNFNGKQSDSKGVLCSEYLAQGMSDICEFYDLPTWAITPAHFKDYMVKTGAKQVNE